MITRVRAGASVVIAGLTLIGCSETGRDRTGSPTAPAATDSTAPAATSVDGSGEPDDRDAPASASPGSRTVPRPDESTVESSRAVLPGVTFEQPSGWTSRARSDGSARGVTSITIEIPGNAGGGELRVQTVRDANGSLTAGLSPEVVALITELEQADVDEPAGRVDFTNGYGYRTVADARYRFVGITVGGRQLVELSVDSGDLVEPLDRLLSSLFVDEGADVFAADSCSPAVEVATEVVLHPGPLVAAGSEVTATWTVRNSGDCAWRANDTWVFTGGDPVVIVDVTPPGAVAPGGTGEVVVELLAPTESGFVAAQWQFQPAGGREVIGTPVPVTFEVS